MAISFSFSQKRKFILPYPEDFSIYVDGTCYLFYSEKLAAFSPKINKLFISDPTLTSIQYPHKDEKKQFSCIKKLVDGDEIQINNENFAFLTDAASFFENENLLNSISDFSISTSKDIFSRLILNLPTKIVQKELEHISGNFSLFVNSDKMFNFPFEYYDIILNSPLFTFSDDHELFKWITKLVKKHGENFASLYSHVNFKSLTKNEIQTFLDTFKELKTNIEGSVLYSVKSIIIQNLPKEEENLPKEEVKLPSNIEYTEKVVDVPSYLQIISKDFPFVDDQSEEAHFKGIFNYLSKDGNPQFRGYVSMFTPQFKKKNYLHSTINYNEKRGYCWNNYDGNGFKKEEQWFSITFFIYKVRLDAYSILIDKEKPFYSQMKHWKVFGSNNRRDWEVIDEQDTDVLNRPHSFGTFKCNNTNGRFFTHFKIEQLENFHTKSDTSYEMILSKIEFFGQVQKL